MTTEFEFLVKENRRLKNTIKEMIEDEKSASVTRIIAIIILGAIIGYCARYFQSITRIKALSNQYQIYYESINTPEYRAVDKCKSEDKFFTECVKWELDNDNKN